MKDRQYTWDLVPVAEKREGWTVIFPAHSAYNHMLTLGPIYNSREEAQKVADRRPDLKPFVAHVMWEQRTQKQNETNDHIESNQEAVMTVQREERGWAGHYICAYLCQFRRNTLLTCGNRRIVISTVGNMYDKRGQREKIGYECYYETMAFEAVWKNGYFDADTNREVEFDSPWRLNENDDQSDQKANDMHEAVVAELMRSLEAGEGAANEA